MDAGEKFQNQFQNCGSGLATLQRRLRLRLGLALLFAGAGIGIGLGASFLLAHVVADGTTDGSTGDAMFASNVTGNAADDSALQAAGTGNCRHGGQGNHQGEGE